MNVKVNKFLEVYTSIQRLNLLTKEEYIDPRVAIENNQRRVEVIRQKASELREKRTYSSEQSREDFEPKKRGRRPKSHECP